MGCVTVASAYRGSMYSIESGVKDISTAAQQGRDAQNSLHVLDRCCKTPDDVHGGLLQELGPPTFFGPGGFEPQL